MRKLLLGLIGLLFAVPAVADTLPAGYTELEYIEGTGTQYIDTGIARGSSNFVVEYDINMVTAKGARFAFAGASWNTSSYLAFDTSDNTFDVGQGKTEHVQGALNTRYKLKAEYKVGSIVLSLYDNNETLLASTTRTSNTWGSSSTASWLFGTVRDIPSSTSFSYTLKSFGGKIWQGTTLVRDFVPAKRNSDNVVGMYDTVSGTFFTNAGTGTFVGGPAVLDSCRNLFDSTPYKTGYYINESGVEQSANAEQYIIRQAVVQPGTQYTLSFVVTQANYTQRYHAYDANGNWLSQVAAVGGSEVVGTKVIKTFTTPANTKYIRQGGRSQSEYQLELGSTATEYVPYCANQIKIATTAYNSARFSPVVTELNDTIATIRSVVTNTINQTKAIADLQATKQTRPDETCPAGKKCLLVEDNDGQPHWYEIIENAYGLPSGYTALEYIESTGTQYIDTGINGKTVTQFEIKGTVAPNGGSNAQLLGGILSDAASFFGARNNQGIYWYCMNSSNGSLGAPSHVSVINASIVSTTSQPGTLFDTETNQTIEFAKFGSTTWAFPDQNLLVFGGASNRISPNAKCYYLKLYTQNGLVADFVPAKNSSGVVGMYDLVSGQFFTNQGTGTFVDGPEI